MLTEKGKEGERAGARRIQRHAAAAGGRGEEERKEGERGLTGGSLLSAPR
jgi:hypothetical protein